MSSRTGALWPRTMPALITPFAADGTIDESAHQHNIDVAQRHGAEGILLAGSTGEGPYLEPGERNALVALARSVSSDLVILCGVFAESDRQASAQIAEAAQAGANACLVVTPTSLVRGRDDAVENYFTRVADAAPLPVFLYTVPQVTAYELPITTVIALAGHTNIAGMKDSGGNAERIGELTNVMDDSFGVYAGNSSALLASSERGAHGAITASANYAQPTVDRAVSGNTDAQDLLTDVASEIQRYGVSGTKFAASLLGMQPGTSRLPLERLDEEAMQRVTEAFSLLS